MTAALPAPDEDSHMAIEDIKNIRQLALGNIAGQILQVSDLVEENISDLSDEFMKLVKCSRQQVDDIITARDLLQGEDTAHEILTETVEISTGLHKNVNKMIYSMQFQDRARQLMQAISVTLEILINLPESMENGPARATVDNKPVISQKARDILGRMIEDSAHKELDRTYILGMFLGRAEGDSESRTPPPSDDTDIEFF